MRIQLSDTEWLFALINERERYSLPHLPSAQVQQSYNARSGADVFTAAMPTYRAFLDGASGLGLQIGPERVLMDFGCGWGRFCQIALRDFAPHNIIGVDVSESAIAECQKIGHGIRVHKVGTHPPVDLPDGSVDFIISNSVFSHLSEDVHLEWISEFHRVLKPEGIVAATTRARDFIRYAKRIREKYRGATLPPYAANLASSFLDLDAALARYDSGEYVFDHAAGTHALGPTFGETCIPKAYAERRWGELFERIRFMDVTERPDIEQAIIFARK